jgi:hypothetical protein
MGLLSGHLAKEEEASREHACSYINYPSRQYRNIIAAEKL